jgi:hypothetical protein
MATSSAVDSYRVSELLKGSENYRTWKFSMRMTLQAKELWEVVGGDETARPESDPKGWDKRAKKALAIIALGMSAAEQEHIIDCETPKEAWDVLEKLYEGKGRNRKFMLLQELFHMSMGTSDFGMDGYLRAIREKLSELSAIGTKLDKDIKLAIILNGLSEEYRYLVVNVEQQETVDFDELSARLIEEEHLIKSNGSIDSGSKLAWTARTKQSARRHGGNGNNANHGDSECYYCGQRGHFKAECPVRTFREEKNGEKAVKLQAMGARTLISM